MQAENLDVLARLQLGLQRVCRLGLVVFDADISLIETEDLHDNAKACKHLFRHLPHEPVVRCNVGFALGGVDDDGVDLADAAGNLHMGWEGGAAHTGDASLVNDLRKLFRAQGIDGLPRLNFGAQGVLKIIFDDDSHYIGTAHIGAGFHGDDLTGHGGVHRHAHPGIVTNLLTHRDHIALFDKGLAGCANVLGHGDYDLLGGGKHLNGFVTGHRLHVFRMDASKKRMSHQIHLCF